jgi:hypothetical protein
MRIRRLRIALPARLRASAEPDGRLIAEAAAEHLLAQQGGAGPRRVAVSGQGAAGHALATRVRIALRATAGGKATGGEG